MHDEKASDRAPVVSVILASYNAAPWLTSTLDSIVVSALRTTWPVELVVVDDGSTDNTAEVLAAYAAACPIPMRVISQENRGRFLAFFAAAEAARGQRILIMGARMLLQPDAFEYLERVEPGLPAGQIWNGHVPTAPDGSLGFGLVSSDQQVVAHASKMQSLEEAGIQVVAIKDDPNFRTDIPDCLAQHPKDACAVSHSVALDNRDEPMLRAAHAVPNVKVIDLDDYFCTPTICPAVVGGVVVYKDKHHLTETFARTLEHMFASQLAAQHVRV